MDKEIIAPAQTDLQSGCCEYKDFQSATTMAVATIIDAMAAQAREQVDMEE